MKKIKNGYYILIFLASLTVGAIIHDFGNSSFEIVKNQTAFAPIDDVSEVLEVVESDIDAASDFLRKWQHEIHSRMTKKDKDLAKTSRILRLENFKELTEKNVIINTGQLQGQRLVDVLMADLMEVA